MKRHLTERFQRSYRAAPRVIQEAFDKQSRLLLENFRYPSLQVKKYDEAKGLWQARVTRSWRFYFKIVGDTYIRRHHSSPEMSGRVVFPADWLRGGGEHVCRY